VNNPEEILPHLEALKTHPGYLALMERYEKGTQDILTTMLDQATDDELTLRLKHAHTSVVELNPNKLLGTLITSTRHKIKTAADAANA